MGFIRATGITSAVVALVLTIAPLSLAGGEPKNESPFTRSAAQGAVVHLTGATNRVNGPIQGEAKNVQPFTAPMTEPRTIDVPRSGGFGWTDAAIGAGAVLVLMLAAAVIVGLARTQRVRKTTTAH
jgi:hypothetical protein